LLDWFAAHARDLPWRRTRDPYAIWISEVMLQQTQVKAVIPYWERWLRELPNVRALAGAPEPRVLKLWEGLGYYRRARDLRRAAQQILAGHGGRIPESYGALLALPGVGRYTAGAIASIAFNQPRPILDGNVLRVLTRVFAVRDNPRAPATNGRLWELAESLVRAAQATGRADACSHCNQALMELGALLCTPRRPNCPACPWRRACRARREGLVDQLPVRPRRAAPTPRRCLVFVFRRAGRYLVRQRPPGVVNAGLWEFPTVEAPAGASPGTAAREFLGIPGNDARPRAHAGDRTGIELDLHRLGTIRCGITRYRFTLEVFTVQLSRGRWPRGGNRGRAERWLPLSRLAALPFSSGQRRVLALVTS
jgi:A/G-specific adenine glycosylase